MTINADKLRSPLFIFIIYIVVSALLIMIFRFIFPGSDAPLLIYSRSWRFTQGLLEVFNLFPALAFSALVIPFGLASFEENYQSFSDMFFKRLVSSVITAIVAAVIYAIVFFLAYPLVKTNEEGMRYSGELYHLAKKNAQESRDAGEWFEASQFIDICDRIWHNSPDLEDLRVEVKVKLDTQVSRTGLGRERHNVDVLPVPVERPPVNATQAIEMSRRAFNEERYFDAHWLANLGSRLAVRGSAEAANASMLASEAWNKIASQAPNRRETQQYDIFNLKLSGYQAMEAQDWINAYYIFLDLLTKTPHDPDARNYFAASEIGAKETAFFIDEMELSMGEILNGAVFSLPKGTGRAVLRFNSLKTISDVAYGFGFEYMEFDEFSNLRASVKSRYAKLIPITLSGRTNSQVVILMHALDRYDQDNDYKSEWLFGVPTTGGIFLDVTFEELSLITNVRHGLTNLQIGELFEASRKLGDTGYVYQIFQAEILNRLGSAFFFLPMAIFIIVIAWRYRAKQKPRYLFLLLLPVLPIVFHGFVFLYRSVFNTLGIWLVLSIGFAAALVVYIVTLAVSLFISLIVLSAQHG